MSKKPNKRILARHLTEDIQVKENADFSCERMVTQKGIMIGKYWAVAEYEDRRGAFGYRAYHVPTGCTVSQLSVEDSLAKTVARVRLVADWEDWGKITTVNPMNPEYNRELLRDLFNRTRAALGLD